MSSADTGEIVLFCECGHKAPQNEVCQYVPGVKCGGPTKCVICRGRVIGDYQEPPAVPPIDPNAMQINEPPLTAAEYAIGDFIGETKIHGHTIHEHQNAWIVMLRRPNGAVINQQIFLRRQGYKFADAVAYAANENAKHNGGG